MFSASNLKQNYVDGGTPHAVNTAWAMLALIYAGQVLKIVHWEVY